MERDTDMSENDKPDAPATATIQEATADTAAPESMSAAVAAELAAALARIASLDEEVARQKDQALRALAESENTRRRAQREIEERERFALSGFARDLVGMADNLRRALDSLGADARAADPKLEQFAQGVELTEREFLATLERHGIMRVQPNGQIFDPNLHQAIAQAESAAHPPNSVMQVVQAGFTINGRILRPALVIVAKAPAGTPEAGQTVDTQA
jgi:molecular chaperone GrpE